MVRPQPQLLHPMFLHPLLRAHPEVWAEVSSALRKKNYESNDRVISHGDTAGNLWLVLSGWLKLTRQTPDGKESIIGLCREGDILGEAALFPNASYPYTAEVVGGSAELVAVPATILRDLVAQDSSLSVHIMALLNERTSQAQLKLEQMTTMSAAQRLGCFLLQLCNTQANRTKTLQIPVEKHVLASYLGMKPETLSRSQQQLKSYGVSVAGHNLLIQDIEALQKFVCDSCSESGNCAAETAS